MHSILIAPGSVTATFLAPVEGLIPACENLRGNRGQCAFPFIFVLRDFVWSD